MLHWEPIMTPEERLDEDNPEIKRYHSYINKCEEATWKEWRKEFLRSLQERHNMVYNTNKMKTEVV